MRRILCIGCRVVRVGVVVDFWKREFLVYKIIKRTTYRYIMGGCISINRPDSETLDGSSTNVSRPASG